MKYRDTGLVLIFVFMLFLATPSLGQTKPAEFRNTISSNLIRETSTLSSTDVPHWVAAYGGGDFDAARSVQEIASGGYIVTGETGFGEGNGDYWVLNLNLDGAVNWEKSYGGTEADAAESIWQTTDDGYVVAGESMSFGAGEFDTWVLKLGDTGTIEWQRAYGGADWELARSVQQTSDGGYIVAGSTSSFGAGLSDLWVLKLDSSGAIEWHYAYGGTDYDEAKAVRQTSDGGYIVAGFTGSFGAGNNDFWILKLTDAGAPSWQKTYGGNWDEEAKSIQATFDGGYIVLGDTMSFGVGWADIWVLKLNSDGTVAWEKTYGIQDSQSNANAIEQTADGGYIVAGDNGGGGAGIHYWLLKLNSTGGIQWERKYDIGDEDRGLAITSLAGGGYLAAGYTTSYGAGSYDALILRVDGDGKIFGCPAMLSTTAVVSDTIAVVGNTNVVTDTSTITTTVTTVAPQSTLGQVTTRCEGCSTDAYITIDSATDVTLTYTDTQENLTTVQVPAGAVTETLLLGYTSVSTVTPPAGFTFARHAFDLQAYDDGRLVSGLVFSVPVTVSITYSDLDVGGVDEEASLTLQYWNGGMWVDAACGTYDRRLDDNWLAVPICHLSQFALFGKGFAVYLPLAVRNY